MRKKVKGQNKDTHSRSIEGIQLVDYLDCIGAKFSKHSDNIREYQSQIINNNDIRAFYLDIKSNQLTWVETGETEQLSSFLELIRPKDISWDDFIDDVLWSRVEAAYFKMIGDK